MYRSSFYLRLITAVFLFYSYVNKSVAQKIPPDSVKIDFSYAGCKTQKKDLSQLPVLSVKPTGKDDSRLLQAAIDHLAKLPLQKNGFRGALLLSDGNYHVDSQLEITSSGIIIQGSKATIVTAVGVGRRTLIEIGPEQAPVTKSAIQLNADASVGSMELELKSINNLQVGDHVVIRRPSTKAWISALGMDTIKGVFTDLRGLQWPAGSRDLVWDRTITAIDQAHNKIKIDAPLTSALEGKFGGATVSEVISGKPVSNIIIKQLNLVSQFGTSNSKDEDHSWIGIEINNAQDVYLKSINAKHFVSSAFFIGKRSRRITLDSCKALEPVSETGGYRRRNFYVEGQQVLVENCFSENGMADFATGVCAAGPNVFLNCTTKNALGASGSIESWSAGTLFENVNIQGSNLFLGYDMERVQAAGWTAANSVVWNCKADSIIVRGHPLAPNLVSNSSISLYQTQLKARGGKIGVLPEISLKKAIPFSEKDILAVKTVRIADKPLTIVNGRFVSNNKVVWGGEINESWWLGNVIPAIALDAGVSITRYVPGKNGPGLTEVLPEMIDKMKSGGMPFYQGGPGLWYDRRRDEHSVKERMDGNVWAAFYEFPWARSGQGKTWDGLSKFDVSQYNPWYFNRIKNFLKLIDQSGFVYYYSMYNTHNVLEIGAHWADYPWRPANNINDTGLPEPPPLEPNNRLHLGNQFYSIDHPGLKKLHEAYINHVLDEFTGSKNVIFNLGYQFPGPVEFQKFFLRTVTAWENRNHKKVRLELGTSKDITDSILNNPEFSKMINVVDMRYWQYKPDGTIWAPKSGQNLAFREINAKLLGKGVDTPPATTPQLAYKQVRE